LASIAGCHNDVEAPIAVDNHGILFLDSRIRSADIGDGLSQTIFVGEVPFPSVEGWASGTRSTLRNTGHPIGGVDLSVPGILMVPGNRPPVGPLSQIDLERGIGDGSLRVPTSFVGGFGSLHPGDGSNFAFGDGSARFLHTTVEPSVLRRLGNRDDGEVIDDDTTY
jgi:prepilin-type processing-associated H-X9-DG protein